MPKILEKPAVEMARHIRVIAGKARPGERDEDLRSRAARKLGISASRARVFWYGETENIRSDEMDRARELAFVAPLDRAEEAIIEAEEFLAGLRARLLAAAGSPTRRVGTGRSLGGSDAGARREADGPQISPHGAAVAR